MSIGLRLMVPLAAVLCLTVPAAWAQSTGSAPVAAALTAQLDAKGRDAVAAPDPNDPDAFVAALYFAGSQLLVVGAKYPVPAQMQERLRNGEFRDAYMDLQAASVTASKWFVHDMQANGLRPTCERGEPFDQVYRAGTGYVVLDGDWARQSLTEREYRARFAEADAHYARMLAALAAALAPAK